MFLALIGWAVATLLSVTGLRVLAALTAFRSARRLSFAGERKPAIRDAKDLPKISLLVPLFREGDIARALVQRLMVLQYPPEKLEALLILEQSDEMTEAALRLADLPDWMRVVTVPIGHPRTKPRAMNYALDFARGEIIGVYDAEDEPAPDQLLIVAEAFARGGADLACLQGTLDFYNVRETWLTRCFTIDYAAWFRLVLPGLTRLGMIVPLGGTTVFLKRDVLEKLGRWDAHNVTEDADLGIRLARRGYRTAFIPSVTREEATARVTPWLRQRSRWIKGYAMTWAVHMRDPVKLWRDLGPKRFFGFQVLFLGTLSQFFLAPLLWSFWLVLFGQPHPLASNLAWGAVVLLGALFLLSEVVTLAVAALAVSTPRHRGLIWWVPLLHFYFPLAALASWKGLAELVTKPFFWDKTAHGQKPTASPRRPWPRFPRPASAGLQTPG
ncbi:MAG: glycosyltransferase [Paracoccaceae bacterium]|nr:glycosyltransferase [Paracoccaceae bacterium]